MQLLHPGLIWENEATNAQRKVLRMSRDLQRPRAVRQKSSKAELGRWVVGVGGSISGVGCEHLCLHFTLGGGLCKTDRTGRENTWFVSFPHFGLHTKHTLHTTVHSSMFSAPVEQKCSPQPEALLRFTNKPCEHFPSRPPRAGGHSWPLQEQ